MSVPQPARGRFTQSAAASAGCIGGSAKSALRTGALPQKYCQVQLARRGERSGQAAASKNWVPFYKIKSDWRRLNPDLCFFVGTSRVAPGAAIQRQNWLLGGNPYFWGGRYDGRQLPYIDRCSHRVAENPEVSICAPTPAVRLLESSRSRKRPVVLETCRARAQYKVISIRLQTGAGIGTEVQRSLSTGCRDHRNGSPRRFRRALELGIAREQINQALLRAGVASTRSPPDIIPQSPGKESDALAKLDVQGQRRCST